MNNPKHDIKHDIRGSGLPTLHALRAHYADGSLRPLPAAGHELPTSARALARWLQATPLAGMQVVPVLTLRGADTAAWAATLAEAAGARLAALAEDITPTHPGLPGLACAAWLHGADLLAPAIQFAEQGFVLDQGDIEMFQKVKQKGDFEPFTRKGHKILNDLAASKKPVVAAIHGNALGVGLRGCFFRAKAASRRSYASTIFCTSGCSSTVCGSDTPASLRA